MAQGIRHRMSCRVPNMCGKLVGKLGAACTVRHTCWSTAMRQPHAAQWLAAGYGCMPGTSTAVNAVYPAPAHLDGWEGYLADVVLGAEAEDAPHLVHRRAPVHKWKLQMHCGHWSFEPKCWTDKPLTP